MKISHRFTLKGKVQAVGMRVHIMRCAARLGVTGKVWNLPDGAVEGFAQHEDSAVLARFKDDVLNGPGRIKESEFLEESGIAEDADFDIISYSPQLP